MAEDFLEEVYQHAMTIYKLERVVKKARIWQDEEAVRGLNDLLPGLHDCIRTALEQDKELGKRLWTNWQSALQVESELLQIADIVELQILPDLYRWISQISRIDVEDEEGYLLKSTRSGFLTLRYHENYMHSCGDPMKEADDFVDDIYDPAKKDYYVYGCGLGYHVYQLYQRLAGYGRIFLCESDPKVLKYAGLYGVLAWIPQNDLVIRQFASVGEFLECAEEQGAGIFIHLPSVHAIADNTDRNLLTERWMQLNTRRYMERMGKLNFIRNMSLGLPDVSALLKQKRCDEAVVVAAGPSVNQYLDVLRSWTGTKVIIAVGTVYKKLLEENIYPDMVAIVDPDPRTAEQTRGIGESKIPLVLAQVAHWEIAKNYSGPQYLVGTQEEYNADVRDKRSVWMSGGTVSFTAIELAIHTGAQRIYLLGLDLAYPQNERYAKGIPDPNGEGDAKLFDVEAVDGSRIKTDIRMNRYRKNIEKLIVRTPDISFYNMSKNGALIRGAIPFEDIK